MYAQPGLTAQSHSTPGHNCNGVRAHKNDGTVPMSNSSPLFTPPQRPHQLLWQELCATRGGAWRVVREPVVQGGKGLGA
eukprot:1157503-Pelagomonas_calceolata.AAC.4